MHDTSADAERVVLAAIRRTDPIERMRQALDLSESMRELAMAGVRARHPDWSVIDVVEQLIGERLIPHGLSRGT